jgi:hypothetical protein
VSNPAVAERLTPQQELAFDIYKELVEINTVTATGDTARAAEAMAARLRAAGFADRDVHVLSPAPRKGNLVVRLRGTGARKPILLLAHLDVVPANAIGTANRPGRSTRMQKARHVFAVLLAASACGEATIPWGARASSSCSRARLSLRQCWRRMPASHMLATLFELGMVECSHSWRNSPLN